MGMYLTVLALPEYIVISLHIELFNDSDIHASCSQGKGGTNTQHELQWELKRIWILTWYMLRLGEKFID